MSSKGTFLVTLATGRQGSSTAACLLKHGHVVHAFVRDKDAPKAKELEKLGCKVFAGSPDDKKTVTPAIAGCQGIFLNLFPQGHDPDANIRQANVILEAATEANVSTVVVSTALNTGRHAELRVSQPNYPLSRYYGAKFAIEDAVKNCKIKYKVYLRPGWLMHNYLEPQCESYFPRYITEHILDVAYEKSYKVSHFDPHDIGKFAGASLMWPDKWNGQVVELGNEQLTIEEVAATISKSTEIMVEGNHLNESDVAKLKGKAEALSIERWASKAGMLSCQPGKLEQYGIKLTTFEEWVKREQGALEKLLEQRGGLAQSTQT